MTAGISLIPVKPALIERRYSKRQTLDSIVLQHPRDRREIPRHKGVGGDLCSWDISQSASLQSKPRPKFRSGHLFWPLHFPMFCGFYFLLPESNRSSFSRGLWSQILSTLFTFHSVTAF